MILILQQIILLTTPIIQTIILNKFILHISNIMGDLQIMDRIMINLLKKDIILVIIMK